MTETNKALTRAYLRHSNENIQTHHLNELFVDGEIILDGLRLTREEFISFFFLDVYPDHNALAV